MEFQIGTYPQAIAVADMTGDGLDDIVAVLEFHNPPSVAVMINGFTPGGDVDGDGTVGINDFLALLALWGPCPDPPAECVADQDADGVVGTTDLLIVLANWS